MAQRKAHEVDSFLKQTNSRYPIVLFYGPDKGLVSERARQYALNTGLPLDDPFVTVKLDATDIESDPTRLTDEAFTIPLFGGDRLIWLKNVAGQKKITDALKLIIAEPPAHCLIVLEASDLKKGVSVRSLIETANNAMACPCYSDDSQTIDRLIDAFLDQTDLALTLEARKWLRANLGGDRLASRSELEKLALYAIDQETIHLEDVVQVVSDVGSLSQDEIIDAMLLGHIQGFNDRFDRYASAKLPFFLLLSAAQRVYQQMQLMRHDIERLGKTVSSVIASARPPIFFKRQKIFEQALRHWSLELISKAMHKVQRAILLTRQNPSLDEAIVRQTLLSLAVDAAKFKKSTDEQTC